MSELPFAHGGAPLRGRLRAEVDDFFVDEQLGFEASGNGEHWLLHIEKRGANTGFVAKQLAAFAGVSERDVGYAGMKDRHAVTRQSFSVLAKKGRDTDWSQCAIEGVTVLSVRRHARKIQRGALRGNAFVIRLRDIEGDRDAAEDCLENGEGHIARAHCLRAGCERQCDHEANRRRAVVQQAFRLHQQAQPAMHARFFKCRDDGYRVGRGDQDAEHPRRRHRPAPGCP